MRKKLKEPEVEKLILRILEKTRGFISIDTITKSLKEKHDIVRSPQVIKRYLEKLESENKIIKQEYGKTNKI